MREICIAILAFIKFFLPPKSNAPEPAQLGWRYKVASTLLVLALFSVGGTLLGLGQFPGVTKGFAMVEHEDQQHDIIEKKIETNRQDITDLRQGFRAMRQDQLDTKLYDIRGRQCAAIITRNEDALRSEGERLRDTLPRYKSVAKEDWRIVPCNEY